MNTLESTLRGTQIGLSDRQRRICLATAQLAGVAGGLNGVAVWMPQTWPVPECVAALEGLCSRIDILSATGSWDGESPCWQLSSQATTHGLHVLPGLREAVDLRAWLTRVAALPEFSDALAPLGVSCGEVRDEQRLWLLAVGAARCDVIGLEQLVQRWSECLEGVTRSTTAPGMLAVQRALSRAAESAEARAAVAYWNRHLEDAGRPAASEEGGTPEPGARFDPRTVVISLPPDLLAKVAEQYAVGAKTLLVVAWIVLINRITGSSQATLWQRFDGRLAPELHPFMGCLCHYLPLMQRIQWTASSTRLVREVERTLSLHERLQDSFSLAGRAPSALPPADLQCAIRESTGPTRSARILQTVEAGEPFRLRLSAELGIKQCDIALHYNSAVVREVQAQCLAQALVRILDGLANPGSTVAEVCTPLAGALAPIMAAEWGTARPEWAAGDQLGKTLSLGLATCRVFESAALDPGEPFHARVLKRLSSLRKACAGVQQPMLGLVAPTCLEATVTTVAALLAAVPVAFVDPHWPVQRKESAIGRIGVSVLIGESQGLLGLSSHLPIHAFEDLAQSEARAHPAADAALQPAAPESIAYVVFSSGSTGTPKPIAVPRRALQNQLLWLRERLPLETRDVLLHRSPLGFDAAVWELLHPVCSGAALVIPPRETGTDSRGIAREVEHHCVSVLQLTPFLLGSLHDDLAFRRLQSLRVVVCGGDRLPCKLAAEVLEGARFQLLNAYGPSECCIQVTLGEVDPGPFAKSSSTAPIGAPMPNSGMHVLSEHLEPLLDGSAGRLFLSGCPVGQGYSADPAATAASFIPMPGQVVAGARMYDTGDLARRVGETVEILGRADRRLKINGVRVDLSVIETCLRDLREVRDVAVLAVRDEYGTGYVTAFLVTDAPAADVTTAARNLVAHTLPSTYQPAHYRCVSQLPVTDRGKVDSEVLMKSAIEMVTAPVVPPRTPLERAIADVWKAVLKRESVGIHDDFFLSGGHSLLFAQVITRLRQMLSLEISLRAIFMHPTIAQLAEHIEAVQAQGNRPDGQSTPGGNSTGH